MGDQSAFIAYGVADKVRVAGSQPLKLLRDLRTICGVLG